MHVCRCAVYRAAEWHASKQGIARARARAANNIRRNLVTHESTFSGAVSARFLFVRLTRASVRLAMSYLRKLARPEGSNRPFSSVLIQLFIHLAAQAGFERNYAREGARCLSSMLKEGRKEKEKPINENRKSFTFVCFFFLLRFERYRYVVIPLRLSVAGKNSRPFEFSSVSYSTVPGGKFVSRSHIHARCCYCLVYSRC